MATFIVETVEDEGETYIERGRAKTEEEAVKIAKKWAAKGYLADVCEQEGKKRTLLRSFEGDPRVKR